MFYKVVEVQQVCWGTFFIRVPGVYYCHRNFTYMFKRGLKAIFSYMVKEAKVHQDKIKMMKH